MASQTLASGSHARISETAATFEYPGQSRDVWRWNRQGMRHNGLEYAFTIRFSEGRTQYSLGYTYWARPNDGEVSGDLAELAASGQVNLWLGSQSEISEAGTLSADGERILLVIDAPEALELLHRVRPKRVTLQFHDAALPLWFDRVRVEYESREQ